VPDKYQFLSDPWFDEAENVRKTMRPCESSMTSVGM